MKKINTNLLPNYDPNPHIVGKIMGLCGLQELGITGTGLPREGAGEGGTPPRKIT